MTKAALTAGSIMVDVFVLVDDKDVEQVRFTNADTAFLTLEQGRKVDATGIVDYVGGGGANTAVAMTRLGRPASVLAAVGADSYGDRALAVLADAGVDVSHVKHASGVMTGRSVMIAAHDQDPTIFTHRGANGTLTREDVDRVDFSAFGLVHLAGLSNESAAIFPDLVAAARKAGCFLSINPGLRQLRNYTTDLLGALPSVDILNLNVREAAAFFSHLATRPHAKLAIEAADREPPKRLADGVAVMETSVPLIDVMGAILGSGVRALLLTDGGKGAWYADGEILVHCPVVPAEIHGTVGAGDAFAATFASLRADGRPPREALLAAACNSASVVSTLDTQSGLLDSAALDAAMQKAASGLALREWRLAPISDSGAN